MLPDSEMMVRTSLDLEEFPWVGELVRFDTSSHRSNQLLIESVREFLNSHELASYLTYNPELTKANLFATVASHTGETRGGIVLSGHTDVVPVHGQRWDSDPFTPVVRNNRLFARGACDMKGFLGVVLDAVPEMQQARITCPIHIALSFDEEVGCAGVPLMLADIQRRDVRPDACIVGEPTSMRVVVAHKGIHTFRCIVRGRAAHSSLQPTGVNAIEYASRIVEKIRTLAQHFRDKGPFDFLFPVPYLTAQTGAIHGGIAVNTIPAECEFTFEFRNLPGMACSAMEAPLQSFIRDVLLPEMHSVAPEASITVSRISSAPPLETPEHTPIVQLVRRLRNDQSCERVAYGTEAGLFSELGIPTLVCGPGDIEQAHKANEFVHLDQLRACRKFIQDLIRSLKATGDPPPLAGWQ